MADAGTEGATLTQPPPIAHMSDVPATAAAVTIDGAGHRQEPHRSSGPPISIDSPGTTETHPGSLSGPQSWLSDLVGLDTSTAVPVSGATAAAILASILAVLIAYIYAGKTRLEGRPPYSLTYVPIHPPS